jgi:uncharacterized protein
VRSTLTALSSLAVVVFASSLLSFSQQIYPASGIVCDPKLKGLSAIREKAQAGDAAAEYQLGRSMLSPQPTEDELAAAMTWFRLSAEQGYPPAQYLYGAMFSDGRWRSSQQLTFWWTKAAEQGEVRAQFWLGVAYQDGRNGVERDYSEAFKWLSKAAEQGNPDAQFTLGQMYEDGEGVPQDYGLAAKWFRKAAEHVPDLGGAGQGRNNLARLYMDGHGVDRDYVSAYMWFALLENPTTEQMDFSANPAAGHMTVGQIAEAQRRAKEWVQKHPAKPLCSSF